MFNFFNPHPEGKSVRDCVKRAIVKATGKDYKEVQLELNRYKKVSGAEKFNDWKNVHSYIENVLGGQKLSFPAQTGQPRMNGERFCQAFPEGTFLLKMAGHLTCVSGGNLFDTWDCSKKCVYVAWRIDG
jgi:hypothetical protein